MKTILTIIASTLAFLLGVWKYLTRKNTFRREEAKRAQEELDRAIKDDSPSDFLDGFNRL